MNPSWTIRPARTEEWSAALALVLRHLPDDQRRQRSDNALALLTAGEISPLGILVSHQEGELVGAVVCLPLKGASGLFWPPQVAPGIDRTHVADRLVRHGMNWLRTGGAKIAQAFVPVDELPLVAPLLRCGFSEVTRLHFMRLDLELPGKRSISADNESLATTGLLFETYGPGNQKLFHETLLKTYEGTLDCPELNGRRTIEEIIEGHQSQGFRAELWRLALHQGQPVGVLMLAEVPAWHGWELSYLGVVPAARRRGLGRILAQSAVEQALEAGTPQLTVAVDARNRPACQLYEKMGFVYQAQRVVLLFFFADLADCPEPLH